MVCAHRVYITKRPSYTCTTIAKYCTYKQWIEIVINKQENLYKQAHNHSRLMKVSNTQLSITRDIIITLYIHNEVFSIFKIKQNQQLLHTSKYGIFCNSVYTCITNPKLSYFYSSLESYTIKSWNLQTGTLIGGNWSSLSAVFLY